MNPDDILSGTAISIANAISGGQFSAAEILQASLERISKANPTLNCFTDLNVDRARTKAGAIDRARTRGESLGPLAGVPYAVKNLFDIAGITTRAGSKINRDNAPARQDAFAIRRLDAAGAVCVGALNMGEYAYDFTGENEHDGHCRNPHATNCMAGGSSSGPAAAVAAGMVPFSLGSDTNGSIRVPASYCGLFGLKPTFGRLSRAGTFPFCASLDHIGPLGVCVEDLAIVYDELQGMDRHDPVQVKRTTQPVRNQLNDGIDDLRIAVADGYFQSRAEEQALDAVHYVAQALKSCRAVTVPEAERARAAAFVITAAESSGLHLARLQTRAADFDPMMRDRLLAGAMIPTPWVTHAQRFRRWYQKLLTELFNDVDIIIAPATPTTALNIGQKTVQLNGQSVPARQGIGIYTQPFSFAGLPVIAAPVWRAHYDMPIGVQIIGAPWQEHQVLRVAQFLEQQQICQARTASAFW